MRQVVSSRWGRGRGRFPPRSAGRYITGTSVAASRGARRRGARGITYGTGPTEARPRCRTSRCCVGATTVRCTRRAIGSSERVMAPSDSRGRMVGCCLISRPRFPFRLIQCLRSDGGIRGRGSGCTRGRRFRTGWVSVWMWATPSMSCIRWHRLGCADVPRLRTEKNRTDIAVEQLSGVARLQRAAPSPRQSAARASALQGRRLPSHGEQRAASGACCLPNYNSTVAFRVSSPEDSRWIGVHLLEELGEARGRWHRLVAVPTEVTVLAVEPPFPLCAHIGEFCNDHFLPFVGRPKGRPLFVKDHRVALDSVTYPNSRPDVRRYPSRAVSRQQFVDMRLLEFGQCQSPSPTESRFAERRRSVATEPRGRGERG